MADYSAAIEAYVDRSRVFMNTNDHQAIVLHGTAGGSSAQAIANFFANDPNMASSHYIVGQDGTVLQIVREVDGACANCCKEPGCDPFWDQWSDNLNWHTLSIEHVNADLHNALPLTDIQKQESFKLIKYLVDKYSVPLDHIKGHNSIDPINRHDCPGPNFPWDELMQYLRGETPMIDLSNGAVANFFTDGGNGTWKCKQTGCIIQGAILQFYRAFGGNDLNGLTYLGLPLSNEVHDFAANPHVVRQPFERGILAYDPNRQLDNPPGVIGDVYLMHIPQPDTQVTQLQSTITSLEGKLQQIAKLASS